MRASLALWVEIVCFAQFLFVGRVCSGRDSDASVLNSATVDSQGNVVARSGPSEVARHPRSKFGIDSRRSVHPRHGEQHRSMLQNHLRPELPEIHVENLSPPRFQQQQQQPKAKLPQQSSAGPGSSGLQVGQDKMPEFATSFYSNWADLTAALWDVWNASSPESWWWQGSGKSTKKTCWSEKKRYHLVQVVHGKKKNEYRISGPSLGEIDGEFFVAEKEDCKNKMGNFTLEVTKYANSTDLVNNSFFILGVQVDGDQRQKGTIHVCAPRVGDEVPTCLAKIEDPGNPLLHSIKVFLGDDWTLWILTFCCCFCGLVLVISSIHAVVLLITMPVPDEEERLKGVQRTGIVMMIGNAILKGTMFVSGVDKMSTAVIRSSLADSTSGIVNGVFFSGLVLSLLGILRLTNSIYYSQIYEVGLRHGKCVLPRARAFSGDVVGQHISMSVLDIVVLIALAIFACLNLKAMHDSANKLESAYEEEFFWSGLGCWQPFPSLLSSLVSNVVKQTVIDQGVCPTQLPALSIEYAEDTTSTILKHVTKHPKVEIGMGSFCETCRQGRDPMVALDTDGEDPSDLPSGSEMVISDIRWHARYIYSKTASRATVCTLPVIVALVFLALVRSVLTRHFYVYAIPTLEYAMPSEGELFPPFNPRIKDYTLYYPQHVSSVAFLNKGDELLAKQRDFTYLGKRSTWELARNYSMHPVPLPGQDPVPFNLSIRVKGGSGANGTGDDASTNYSIAMTKVERFAVTAKFVETNGPWKRCSLLHVPFPGHHITVPTSVQSITMEVSVLLHVWGIPMSLEAWQKAMQKTSLRNTTSFPRTTGVFLPKPGATTSDECSQACFDQKTHTSRCIFSRQAHGGCYLVMIPTSPDTCEKLHEAGVERNVVDSTVNPAIHKVLGETERKMNLCEGNMRYCSDRQVARDKVLTASLSGRFFSPVTLNLSHHYHNVFTASWSSRSREQPLRQPIFHHKFHVWRAQTALDDIIVVPEKGVKATKSGVLGQPFSVHIQKYEVARIGKPIRLLIVARVRDWAFQITFPPDGVENVSAKDMHNFDLEGACDKLKWDDRVLFPACSKFHDAWNNTGNEWQAVAIVPLDPLFPTKTLSGKIERLHPEDTYLEESTFTLEFKAAEAVSKWALQPDEKGNCNVSLLDRTPEEAYMMLADSVPAIADAISSCSSTLRVETKDGTATFSTSGYFLWIMRNTMTKSRTIELLEVVLEKHEDVVERSLHFGSSGIFAKEPESPESIPPSFKRVWDAEYKLDWPIVLMYTRNISRLLCYRNIGSAVEISPRDFVHGMHGYHTEERRLSRLRSIKEGCSRMPKPPFRALDASDTERAWSLTSTSPIALAISQRDNETLKALLEKYGDHYTRLIVADDPQLAGNQYKLTYMDLAIANQCFDCADSIQQIIEEIADRCPGDRATRSAGNEDKECAKFRSDHTRLTLGPWSFKSDKAVVGTINISRSFSEKVKVQSVRFANSGLSNERLAEFQPMWQSWKHLDHLRLQGNEINLCGVQSECLWTPEEDKRVEASWGKQESYPTFEDAKKACAEHREAHCKRISCNSMDECTLFFLEHDNEYPERDSPGSRIYRPSAACHEERLFNFLSLLPELTKLTTNDNQLCNRGIQQIVRALPAESKLTNVSLRNVRMTAGNLTLLSEFGKKTRNMKNIDIGGNQLGAKGFLALLGSDSITHLNASSIRLDWKSQADQTDFGNLTKRLSQLADIEHLDLSHNSLGDEGLAALLPAFNNRTKLKYLNLCNTSLTWQSVRSLQKVGAFQGLQELYLGENNFTDLDVEGMGFLICGRPVQLLDLHSTGLSDLNVNALLNMWHPPMMSALHRLELWNNDLPYEFLDRFARLKLVKRLGLAGNRWEDGDLKNRSQLVGETIPDYKDISFGGILDMSVVNSRCWERFANGAFPFQLERLRLDRVKFTDKTLQDQFSFFRMLPKLEVLKVRWNDFPTEIVRGLLGAASSLPNLQEFAITGNNFSLQDWPSRDSAFPKLKILTGDFNPTDMMFLRHWLPYAVIRTTMNKSTDATSTRS